MGLLFKMVPWPTQINTCITVLIFLPIYVCLDHFISSLHSIFDVVFVCHANKPLCQFNRSLIKAELRKAREDTAHF